ncbi:hypothetical protein EV356DRAFT_526741 [Viridothelium virens]|uniref:Sin3-associated polypeptide Sap18 n=1 Tax=Viridothelium virens TaxID=1048519 RepID=A0A6A6GYC1_VIRVR|nr:hypothetical protein EV356DRAFT_526741 [Viridothelium virens]
MSNQGGPKIDRQTTTPFLLRLCYRNGSFHRPDEFPTLPSHPTPSHLQIYTWQSCTLRELTALLTSALPSNILPSPLIGTRLAYRLIYQDTSQPNRPGPGRYLPKDIGNVVIGAGGPGTSGDDHDDDGPANGEQPRSRDAERLEGDAEKTLQDARFVIGDYVCVAILPPLANGAVAAPPPPAGASSYGGSRGGRGDFGGGGRGGMPPPRENGYGGGGFRGRGPPRGGYSMERGGFPSGEWRRGERLPDGSSGGGGGGYGRGRGRGRGY